MEASRSLRARRGPVGACRCVLRVAARAPTSWVAAALLPEATASTTQLGAMSTGRPSAELAAAMVPRVEAREAVTVSTVTPPVVGALGTPGQS